MTTVDEVVAQARKQKKVFTTGQVAKIAKVAPRTVSKWFDSGRIKGYRIPGSQDRRIPRENLIKFLKDYGMPLDEFSDEDNQKILFAGVDQVFAAKLQRKLTADNGYSYESVSSLFEAGAILKSFMPDVVIIDMSFGRTDATNMAKSLRTMSTPASPIFTIGLVGEDEAEPENFKEHFDAVYQHPVDVRDVIDTLAVWWNAVRGKQ